MGSHCWQKLCKLTAVVQEKLFWRCSHTSTTLKHTGGLESLHNHILMYCPKRHSYFLYGLQNQRYSCSNWSQWAHWTASSDKSKTWWQFMYMLLRHWWNNTEMRNKNDNPNDPHTIFHNRFMVLKPSEDWEKKCWKSTRKFIDFRTLKQVLS